MNILRDYVTGLTHKLTEKLQKQKEELILLRIKERVGEDIDLMQEIPKRFPRIVVVCNNLGQEENWYWNDGSDNGLLLITFFQDFDSFFDQDIVNKNFKMGISLKYV